MVEVEVEIQLQKKLVVMEDLVVAAVEDVVPLVVLETLHQ